MPRLNEKAMRVCDNMIAEADKQGLQSDPAVDRPLAVVGRRASSWREFYHEKAEDFYRTDSEDL